jgi:hypothetical protein
MCWAQKQPAIPEEAAGHVFHIANNLPYATRLKYDWSTQAPQGIVGLTVIAFEVIVGGIVAELKAKRRAVAAAALPLTSKGEIGKSRKRDVSLYAENEDGLRFGGLIVDPDALESLEAAAELVYEMDD